MSSSSRDEGFAARWSRRKQAARDGLPDPADAETAAPKADPPAPEPMSEQDILERFSEDEPELAAEIAAIDIDAMTPDDDFTIFMKEKVPDFIRRRALNHLWSVNPVFGHLDGLNEYDDDYTDAAMLVGEFKSAWQPGTGYARPGGDRLADLTPDSVDEPETGIADDPEAESASTETQGGEAEPDDPVTEAADDTDEATHGDAGDEPAAMQTGDAEDDRPPGRPGEDEEE